MERSAGRQARVEKPIIVILIFYCTHHTQSSYSEGRAQDCDRKVIFP